LCDAADRLGAAQIATGHYAAVERDGVNGRVYIRRVPDARDQSYMLCRLTQPQLARLVLPLGGLDKQRVRSIAREAGIAVADKGDSQEICFIRGESYAGFIARQRPGAVRAGSFVLAETGEVVGTHGGVAGYTVGQRKGLGLSLGRPVFVRNLDAANGTVFVSYDDPVTPYVRASDAVCQRYDGGTPPERTYARVRHSADLAPCTFTLTDDTITAIFDGPVRAVTPGQSLVVYDEDGGVLCCGTIMDN